jgi:predicted Zn-dependent peptidase
MIKKEILSNGLCVVTEDMPHVRSVTVGIWLRRGSRHEQPSESGIAHFIEHMVFKGTNRRSQVQIAQELDAIGGQSDAFTTKEYASFHAKVLDEHLPRVMDLLADIVLNPSFDGEELERERKVIFEEIAMAEDTHDDLAHELFIESFWPDHPLGRPILGTRETVGRFTRDDLLRFFHAAYTPDNLIVAAAGNLEHDDVVELVRNDFDPLARRPDRFSETPPRVETAICCRERELEQVHLVMGTVAPPQNHEDRYASYVLNTILGGTMSSRLFQIIREDRGLVYSVFSGLTSYRDAGNLTIYAGTSPQNVTQVIDLVMKELRRIKTDAVQEDEMRRAKDHLKGSIMLGLESTGARMSQLARYEMYFSRHISLDEILEGIEQVTRDDVLRLATTMIEGRALGLTAVGNLEHFEPERGKLVA